MKNGKQLFSFLAIHLILVSSPALASEAGIGFYTAVSGRVTVEHSGEAQVFPVKLNDQVWFKDVIETSNESRTKAFFEDDSVLTVGQNSRVEINEYVYQPEHNTRRAIVKLMQGQVRALVSKIFKANGSKFEVHTPSAVAAARGTYFTVWVENGQSGIINIGEEGRVDFTSGGKTVTVDPGFFSIAQEGSAPSVPMPHYIGVDNDKSVSMMKSAEKRASTAILTHDRDAVNLDKREKLELMPTSTPDGLSQALAAVEATTLRDAPIIELPADTLRALNVDASLIDALGTLTGLSTVSSSIDGETTTFTTGTLTNGTLAVGSLSVGTTATSGAGTLSIGSVSTAVAPVTSAVVTPLTSVISTVVAPVAPVTSSVLTPLAPVVSPVVAPVTTVISPIVAPVAPVISPVMAPLAPLLK